MRFRILLSLALFAAACAPLYGAAEEPGNLPPDTAVTSPPEHEMPTNEQKPNPFAPEPGDAKLTRGSVFINEKSLVIRESYPPQISLAVKGDLPTPCHALRAEVTPPDAENRIRVDAYSVVDPEKACIQVLEPFEEYIDLGTFPAGHYSVWVNRELAGEFDS